MSSSLPQDDVLDRMQYMADALADNTIAHILGPWTETLQTEDAAKLKAAQLPRWEKLAAVSAQFQQWDCNQSLNNWQPGSDLSPEITAALQDYLATGKVLPDWAEPAKIARAEALFYDYGVLSCTLLFCASLPECYVIPDLSAVLHVAGQLEQHTEYRIRSTAAMIFPVMLKGGLCSGDGSGIAQILKVRLIHATIRNLILRGSPAAALLSLGDNRHAKDKGILPPLPELDSKSNMYQSLFAHGWQVGKDGLPCNQEELAYTLLTFGYVFLNSMRKLGIGLSRDDELAYLHIWNVVGHILGIQRELMPETMEEGAALFARMQARGRANPILPDPRPALGQALIGTMRNAIPLPFVKSFPALMTRYLCGRKVSKELGINSRIDWISRLLFAAFMLLTRGIDSLVRLFVPGFSLSRFMMRIAGYHLVTSLLMDQTRPLKLPEHLLNNITEMIGSWGWDNKAPKWLNGLEDKLTNKGNWIARRKK